jgi:hypothetical protein
MTGRKPKPRPYSADCIVESLGGRIEARYLRRCADLMSYAWVQLEDGTVCTVAVQDLYILPIGGLYILPIGPPLT